MAEHAAGAQFTGLALVLGLAVLVPLLFSRLRRARIPVVVGEILAGMLVGRSGLGWVQPDDPVLTLLAEIGFVVLMFLAGMEIDLTALGVGQAPVGVAGRTSGDRAAPPPWVLALEHFALTLALALGFALLIVHMGLAKDMFLIALVISTTSLGVVMPVLKERGLLGERYGQTLLVTALVADFATMLLITVRVAVLSHGLTFEVLLVGLLFLVLALLYRLGVLVLPGLRPLLEELSHATTRIKVRMALLLMVAFVALAELLGAEIILGAFLGGLLLTLLAEDEDEALYHQLESIGYGFLVPVFFIMVGVDFDLQALAASRESFLLLGLLLLAAVVTKVVPALVFRQVFPWRESLVGGVLLSARLSLIIAAAEIGRSLGVLSEAVLMDVILIAVVTVTLAPMLFAQWAPRPRQPESSPVVIVGCPLGLTIASQLHHHGSPYLLLGEDEACLSHARRMGLRAHQATPEEAEQWLTHANALLLVQDDPEAVWAWAQYARGTLGLPRVIALATTAEQAHRLRAIGVLPITPVQAQASFFTLMARSPDLVHLLTETKDQRDVLEVHLMNPALDGVTLRELGLPPHVLVLAIHRGDAYLIPRGQTRLQMGDKLTLLGTLEALEQVFAVLAQRQ